MESPTSSENPPTEPASAETVEAKEPVKYKEEDGIRVDERASQRFLMSFDHPGKMGLKCGNCHMVTSHAGIVVTMYEYKDSATEEKVRVSKRVVGCQNCGKISTK